MLEEPEQQDKVFKVDTGRYANVFIDSDWDIQVCMYADEECEEEEDGGGICTLMTEDEDDENSCHWIIKNGTVQQISKLVADKAEFVWELMTGENTDEYADDARFQAILAKNDIANEMNKGVPNTPVIISRLETIEKYIGTMNQPSVSDIFNPY